MKFKLPMVQIKRFNMKIQCVLYMCNYDKWFDEKHKKNNKLNTYWCSNNLAV